MDGQTFLTHLAKVTSAQLPQKLSKEAYLPIFKALESELEFVPPDQYRAYLEASARAVVDFTRALLERMPTEPSPFQVPLQDRVNMPWWDLARPFIRAEWFQEERFTQYVSRFATFDSESERQRERARVERENEKAHQESMEDPDYRTWFTFFLHTPFWPHRRAITNIGLLTVPFEIEQEARFQNTWIISPTGTGKTTLLENLIRADMERAIAGQGSVIVLDSQNDLIQRLASLYDPADGKVILLEPSSENPLALNIFDNTTIDYENSLELADFVLGSLLDADLTGKQSGLFRYLAQAMQVIPDATIFTLAELLERDGYERYREHILKLRPHAVSFFENRFRLPTFNGTKDELWWRLDAVLSDPVFADMFSHPRNRLNLAHEIDQNKIILVNTGRLKAKGVEVFGRFIIAMLYQATSKRLLKYGKGTPPPVYLWVDECQDYIANEPMIGFMIDKLRKQRVAMAFAHQRMISITDPGVRDALTTSRVQFAGRMINDAAAVARHVGVEPEVLQSLPADPPYKFAFTQGRGSVVLTCPPPILSRAEIGRYYEELQRQMRERYCAPPLTREPVEAPPKPIEEPEAPTEAENVVPIARPPAAVVNQPARARARKPVDDIPL